MKIPSGSNPANSGFPNTGRVDYNNFQPDDTPYPINRFNGGNNPEQQASMYADNPENWFHDFEGPDEADPYTTAPQEKVSLFKLISSPEHRQEAEDKLVQLEKARQGSGLSPYEFGKNIFSATLELQMDFTDRDLAVIDQLKNPNSKYQDLVKALSAFEDTSDPKATPSTLRDISSQHNKARKIELGLTLPKEASQICEVSVPNILPNKNVRIVGLMHGSKEMTEGTIMELKQILKENKDKPVLFEQHLPKLFKNQGVSIPEQSKEMTDVDFFIGSDEQRKEDTHTLLSLSKKLNDVVCIDKNMKFCNPGSLSNHNSALEQGGSLSSELPERFEKEIQQKFSTQFLKEATADSFADRISNERSIYMGGVAKKELEKNTDAKEVFVVCGLAHLERLKTSLEFSKDKNMPELYHEAFNDGLKDGDKLSLIPNSEKLAEVPKVRISYKQ